jgi:hypothetical protein
MANIKISDLTEGTVVDNTNDWFVYVDTSDPTQNPFTGTTLKLRPSNVPISTAMQTALNGKENTITAGTTSQYFRGDKTFQTLDKTSVGLSNVDNTSDLNKPISTATQTALNAKQNTITTGTISQYFRGDLSLATLDKTAVGLGNVANVDTTTTANITDASNKRFITDAQQTVLGNTSGTNTGDNAVNTLYSGLATSKENTITAGTTSQYFRGDKTFQALDKTAVGLGNVANATTTISTSAPSGGADGDIWFQYTP